MSKKKIIIILVLLVIAILVSYYVISISLFLKRIQDGLAESYKEIVYEAETQDGEVFVIEAYSFTFPDYELSLYVFCGDKQIGGGGVNTSLIGGTSEKEFVESVVREWHSGDIHIYEFGWGMIYSKDNKKTFRCIMQLEYDRSKAYTELRDLMQ